MYFAAFKQSAVTLCLAPQLIGETEWEYAALFSSDLTAWLAQLSAFSLRSEDVEEFAVEFELDMYADEFSEGEKT